MNRIEFSKRITQLLNEMLQAGENFIIDYVYRSAEEQKRLFEQGKSKCDGYRIKSAHQEGRAMDIYFLTITDDGYVIDQNGKKYEKWHKIWEEKYGGKPMISWDKGHFE